MNNDLTKTIKPRLGHPLVLAGLVGGGKSHVGRLLTAALNLDFIDSDAVVEGKAGCAIPEIFERDGEGRFRTAEAATIAECLERGPLVLSTGGGALMNAQTLELVKSRAIGVWIQAGME